VKYLEKTEALPNRRRINRQLKSDTNVLSCPQLG